MAFSPTDPIFAHSLGLQLRATRRKHSRPRWRSDWMPLWVVLLLISLFVAFSVVLLPPIDSLELPQQATETGQTGRLPLVGALAEPFPKTP